LVGINASSPKAAGIKRRYFFIRPLSARFWTEHERPLILSHKNNLLGFDTFILKMWRGTFGTYRCCFISESQNIKTAAKLMEL
jgi:hypothetical protein